MTDVQNPARPARASLLAAAIVSGLLGIFAASARADDITLAETGSTLLYPLFNIWASEYPKTHPTVKITTASTGSGAGIEQAISGAAQIGASDGYMSDAEIKRRPQIINVRDGDLGADRQLQLARPRGREFETRRAERSPAFTRARFGLGTIGRSSLSTRT